MRKILNTFKYGDTKVKLILGLTLLAGVCTFGFALTAILVKNMLFFFGAIIAMFVTISLAQTFVIEGEASEPSVDTHEAETPSDDGFSGMQQADMAMNALVPEMELPLEDEFGGDESIAKKKKRKKKAKKVKEKKQKKKKARFKKASEEADEYAEEMDELLAEIENSLNVAQGLDSPTGNIDSTKKVAEETLLDDDIEVNTFDEAEKKFSMREDEEEEPEIPQQASEEVMATYNKKKIKKVMHKFKVKREHRLIMIDKSEKLNIRQTPAYMWLADKELHFLLIEKEPRHIAIPEYQFREVTYLKKQLVNEDVDYGAFKGNNMLSDLFRPYLPDYTHSTVVDDLSAYKNLYGLGNEIFVTNRSAAALFDLLPVEFRVDDKVTLSTKVNTYFKEAYKANIMLRDNVIDANGYADKISNTLNNLAHSTISYAEFKDTLNLMIKNKLITQEFAMYYMDIRNKL